jgi:hypothetical protein
MHDDLDEMRASRARRQRLIAMVVILALALPGGAALWALLT